MNIETGITPIVPRYIYSLSLDFYPSHLRTNTYIPRSQAWGQYYEWIESTLSPSCRRRRFKIFRGGGHFAAGVRNESISSGAGIFMTSYTYIHAYSLSLSLSLSPHTSWTSSMISGTATMTRKTSLYYTVTWQISILCSRSRTPLLRRHCLLCHHNNIMSWS